MQEQSPETPRASDNSSRTSRREFVKAASAVSIAGSAGLASELFAASLTDYEKFDAIGLADLVRRKEVSPEELLEAAIERVEATNPKLNAIVTKMYDEARRTIRQGVPNGPFRGVPIVLKDTGAPYAGVRFTAASKVYANRIAEEDDELVTRYKRAGLVTIGRTNAPEFGINVTTEPVLFGPTRNPWDLSCSTGGSSGGAAAAVAARMVPMAQGGDGGGSIRIPASCCGVFGMKPSRGRMPTGPGSGEIWEGFVTYHALTLSVRDNAALMDATAGPEIGAPYGIVEPKRPFLEEVKREPDRLKIAWTTKGGSNNVHPDCVAAVRDAADLCRELGHEVEDDSPDIDYEDLAVAFDLIVRAHTAAMIDDIGVEIGKTVTKDMVEPWTWDVAERGRSISAVDFAKTKSKLNRATRALGRFFTSYDILLTPTLGSPPTKLGHFDTVRLPPEELHQRIYDFIPYTWLHNVTGTPAMSVPQYWNKDGLPIGVQFATKLAGEATLYRLAGQLERARPWNGKLPQI